MLRTPDSRGIILVGILLAVLAAAGCGGGKTESVKGEVRVTESPSEEKPKAPPSSKTDEGAPEPYIPSEDDLRKTRSEGMPEPYIPSEDDLKKTRPEGMPEPYIPTDDELSKTRPDCGWAGSWDTNWGAMKLTQSGGQVSGSYSHDQGKIAGKVSGMSLTGTWSEAPSYAPPDDAGGIVFVMSNDCQKFDGQWWYDSKKDSPSHWSGTRAK